MSGMERTVLVVEADPSDLASTVNLLESAGYKTVTASSFEQATSTLRTAHPDLIVTAMRLGAYNGLHLVLRGRVTDPQLPAIVTTHFPDPVLADETRRMEAVHLLRPLDSTGFLAEVSRLLHNGRAETLPSEAILSQTPQRAN